MNNAVQLFNAVLAKNHSSQRGPVNFAIRSDDFPAKSFHDLFIYKFAGPV